MKVGVLGHGFVGWGGGLHFTRLIARALVEAKTAEQVHIFLPLCGPVKTIKDLRYLSRSAAEWSLSGGAAVRHVAPSVKLARQEFEPLANQVQVHIIDDGSRALRRALRRNRIDVVIPAFSPLPPAIGVPWVGYIYDFQHRYLPHFFSTKEIRLRDKAFSTTLTMAPAVIVNSRKTEADIRKFVPEATARIFVLPFAPFPDVSWLSSKADIDKAPMRPYFIVCNQFWAHKDHLTALRAFAQVAEKYPEVDLVCTGPMHDYRQPHYVQGLLREIERLGIAPRVKLLGMLAKHEQIKWLKGSVALLQPTLFEGGPGGGAVYDAVGLGVPAFVSNIEVNLEIENDLVRFFEAGNPGKLAELMSEILANNVLRQTDPDALLEAGRRSLARCGLTIDEALRFVLKVSRGSLLDNPQA